MGESLRLRRRRGRHRPGLARPRGGRARRLCRPRGAPGGTLAADTNHGNRPGFEPAAPPDEAEALFGHLVNAVGSRWPRVQTGQFGADMEVELVNTGPVTFSLRVPPRPVARP